MLCLSSKPPLPDYTGSRRRIARTVQALAGPFQVELAFVGGFEGELEDLRRDLGVRGVHQLPSAANSLGLPQRLLRRLRQRLPLHLVGADLSVAGTAIARLVAEVKPDLIWVSGAWVGPFLPDVLPVPLVLDLPHSERATIDRELRSLRRRPWASLRRFPRAVKLLIDRSPRLAVERACLARAALVTTCSNEDLASVDVPSGTRVVLVPNGIDMPPPTFQRRALGHRLLLVGDLFYPPNREAAQILVHKVLPLVRLQVPSAQIDLVGACPDELRRSLASDACIVHGMVPDLLPLYERSTLAVMPIYSGSGTRTKVLEACGYHVPVVTTPMGLEGLEGLDGEVDVATAPEALADRAVHWLLHADAAEAMADRAFQAVTSLHMDRCHLATCRRIAGEVADVTVRAARQHARKPARVFETVRRTKGVLRRARRAWHRQFVDRMDLAGVVYDVGAHFGSFSSTALEHGATVVAIEPAPFCADELVKLASRYPARFTHVAAAVGSASSRQILHMPLYKPGEGEGRSTSSSLDSEFIDSHNQSDPNYYQDRIEVDVVTIDSLMEKFGTPVFLKIDVEGYEIEALNGLTDRVPVMQFKVTAHRADLVDPLIDRCASLGMRRFVPLDGRTQQRLRFRRLRPGRAKVLINRHLRVG